MNLPRLKTNDYLEKNYDFWKSYRLKLTEVIKEESIIEKTPENIYEMSKKIGIKPTSRYFNIEPSQVRYFIKKYEKENNTTN